MYSKFQFINISDVCLFSVLHKCIVFDSQLQN